MTDRYAVIGNPIAHSKSPQIHAEFARQTNQNLHYERLLAPLDGFRETVEDFRAQGGKGANVTLPFKLEAFALASERSSRANDAGAANVLKFDGSTLFADNTDGVGLVRDIEANLGFAIEGRNVLLVGAGGAAQGAVGPLLAARPARLVITNRTDQKARELAERFAPRLSAGVVHGTGYAEVAGGLFDLVINATSASLNDAVPDLPARVFGPGSLAYEMMYGRGNTPFLDLALSQGAARIADGLGMLVEQAAESFLLWRGVRPQTAPVIAALKGR